MYKKPERRAVTVASGQTTSEAFYISDYTIAGVLVPAEFDGTAITFTASDSQTGTYYPVYDSDGNQVSLSASASRAIGLSGAEADACAAFTWFKLVCGTSQTGDTAFVVRLK